MATQTQPGNPFKALNALTWSQRISLVGLAAAVVGGIVALIYFMNQEQYQTLYSDLGHEEAGTIVERLKAQKVLYTVDDSGKSIKVPSDRVNELRLQLASEGLPQGGKIGFEIFDRTNLGMTEFVERVSYKRALEGELARTILSLKEIGQARVHLVLPKDSLFEDREEETKASVVLKLKSGRQLSESVVSGIVHLVSSAVEGLTPGNVTVVDANGRMLSESNSGTPEEALTTAQMELKTHTEKELTAKIINILEPVVGEGRVKADTSVLIDFSRREETEEKFDPQAIIRSQVKSQEQSQPAAAATAPAPAAGVPGTKSNGADPGPTFIPLAAGGGASFSKQSETTNYEVSKVVRKTLEPTATIQKLSVAVIVDDALQPQRAGETAEPRKTAPRSPEDLKKIKDLVSAAVGIDSGRGDLLTVENIAFEAPPEMEDAPTGFLPELKTLGRPALRYTSLLILFLLAYLLLYRPLSKRIFVSVDETLSARATGKEVAESAPALSLATPKTVKELEAALGESLNTPQVTAGDINKTDILKQRIAEFVQREPEKGAQLVRSWLIEEGKG
jgi:flagellar M-ring protein FliF